MVGLLVAFILFYLVGAFSLYGMFGKANVPTWYAFVPIVNIYGLLLVAGRPGWWLLLFLIPIVDVFVGIIVLYDIAQSFGYGVGMTILLVFFALFVFYYLSYGDPEYRGPRAVATA
jgi:hypothetical protein